jgi:hypothetical protein
MALACAGLSCVDTELMLLLLLLLVEYSALMPKAVARGRDSLIRA